MPHGFHTDYTSNVYVCVCGEGEHIVLNSADNFDSRDYQDLLSKGQCIM